MRFGTHKSKELTAEEARLLVERLAAISDANLPLASGLRSAATEMPSNRLRAAMRQLADRVEQGESMEEVLRDQLQYCDAGLRGAIAAALSSGQIGDVLGRYIEQQQTRRALAQAVRGMLAYPILLLTMCLALAVLFSIFVMPDFANSMSSLSLSTSWLMRMMQWWGQTGVWYLLAGMGSAAVFVVVLRLWAGAARWQRLKERIPLLGPLFQWMGILEWSRMTSLLLNQNIPLAQAAEWAAQGASDAAIRRDGARLAAGIEQGKGLADVLKSECCMPGTLKLMVGWGEQTDQLPAALATAADYFEDRVRLRLALLRIIVPAIVFTIVALVATLLFGAFAVVMWSAFSLIWWWYGITSPPTGTEAFRLLNLLAPLALGGALVWVVSGIQSNQHRERGNALLNVLELTGWLLAIGSTLLLLLGAFGAPILLPFTIAYFVTIVVVRRYRESERRALSTALAIAAERQIPLGQAVRAFSSERHGAPDGRAQKLADLLDLGVPLDDAMKQSRIRFSREVLLAVRIRGLAGDLGPTIRDAMRRAASVESLANSVLEKLLYLFLIVMFGTGVLWFWVVSLSPIFTEMFAEFGYDAPRVTEAFMAGMAFFTDAGFLGGYLAIGATVLFVVCVLAYLRWLPWEFPLLRRLWLPVDSSNTLHCLSLSARCGRPMLATLNLLRQQYPKRGIRRRLRRSVAFMEQGGNWCQGLRKGGLINKREAALLESAERVGNLAWALDETAERLLQRALFRLRRILDILFPLALLCIGAGVLLIAILEFVPLVYIIKHNV